MTIYLLFIFRNKPRDEHDLKRSRQRSDSREMPSYRRRRDGSPPVSSYRRRSRDRSPPPPRRRLVFKSQNQELCVSLHRSVTNNLILCVSVCLYRRALIVKLRLFRIILLVSNLLERFTQLKGKNYPIDFKLCMISSSVKGTVLW